MMIWFDDDDDEPTAAARGDREATPETKRCSLDDVI